MEPAPALDLAAPPLPAVFARWFAGRGWAPRAHQLELLAKARAGRSALLIAPTGGGKTLAGFLPTLVELSLSSPPLLRGRSPREARREGRVSSNSESVSYPAPQPSPARGEGAFSAGGKTRGLHTLYISPLKALAVDIARNLEIPVREMGLPVRLETRTGDTPASKRQRQRRYPPDILLTTPEQLALLLASADAPYLFGTLKRVVLDELHALVTSKRGDLLSLGLARLFALAPQLTTVGLSATVAEPADLCRFLVPQPAQGEARADLVIAQAGAQPGVAMLDTAEHLPWAGHSALHALGEIYAAHQDAQDHAGLRQHAQPGRIPVPDAVERQRRQSRHRAASRLARCRAAPQGRGRHGGRPLARGGVHLFARSRRRLGRRRPGRQCRRAQGRLAHPAAHRPLEPSAGRAVASRAGARQPLRSAGMPRRHRGDRRQRAGYAAFAHGCVRCAWRSTFSAARSARRSCRTSCTRKCAPPRPTRRSRASDFDAAVDFVATGGYALKAYERFAKIRQGKDGRCRITHPRVAQRYRMNVGTIVEADMIKVRLVRSRASGVMIPRRGRILGEVEEYFIETLTPGDTFVFAGEILKYEALVEDEAYVSRSSATDPKVPAYEGGKFPLSTYLAARVRAILADNKAWRALPSQVREWLEIQAWRSLLPRAGDLLVETFPRAAKYYLVCYPFEGRLAHQTLGMLLTRRLERAGQKPLGFVANEYALAVWGVGDLGLRIRRGELSLAQLFDQDMLGDDLEAWLAESALMKRTFRSCAIIAGLIERRFPGEEKSRRQLTVSTDLVYDVLRKHQGDHLLLRAARADAATGLLDIKRLSEMLSRIEGRIVHKALDHVSPLAVPVLLEIGRETVYGEAADALLAEAADELMKEAMR